MNVIGLPKTIDNDIWGTDVTFGFHTAVDIATDVIDRIHTTAASHGRCMVIELMGNKAGWLTLYAGVAGGADVVILPEFPYNPKVVSKAILRRAEAGKDFSIIAVAEGAMSIEEAKMKKKERAAYRAETGFSNIATRIARELESMVGVEARAVVPGHVQRGGTPSAYDRMLSTIFGVHAAELINEGNYGQAVAMIGSTVGHNPLGEIAGKTKFVPEDNQIVNDARAMGISFGV
jgi:6-phosphofructokinase 1